MCLVRGKVINLIDLLLKFKLLEPFCIHCYLKHFCYHFPRNSYGMLFKNKTPLLCGGKSFVILCISPFLKNTVDVSISDIINIPIPPIASPGKEDTNECMNSSSKKESNVMDMSGSEPIMVSAEKEKRTSEKK